jgi:cytochrome c peroxidase
MPQIGPGKGDGFNGLEDFGRARVTANPEDRFQFRTPTLRNVRQSGPWGHSGAYDTLEAVVLHHFDPRDALENYNQNQAVLPSRADLDALDFIVMDDPTRVAEIAAASEITIIRSRPTDMHYLMDFLDSLTDPAALDMRADVPRHLPSGLPLAN